MDERIVGLSAAILSFSQTTGRLTLCVDRASERVIDRLLAPFREDGGKVVPFFNGTEVADATKQALTFCNQFQVDFNATRAMIDKIDAHESVRATPEQGDAGGRRGAQPHRFPGDGEPAFNKLSDEAFLDLRKSGALGLVYCHLASSNSWTSLVYQASIRGQRR